MSPTTASGKDKTSRELAVLGQLMGKIPYRVGWQVAWPEAAPGMGRKGPLAQAPGPGLCQLLAPFIGIGKGAPPDLHALLVQLSSVTRGLGLGPSG